MSIGLVRNPQQPAARHFSSSPFIAWAVSAMIGTAYPRPRNSAVAEYPSRTGICMSMRTRS